MKKEEKKKAPEKEIHSQAHKPTLGVKIISIYEYVKAGFSLIAGIIMVILFFTWDKVLTAMPKEQVATLPQEVLTLSKSVFLSMGIGYILMGGLLIVISLYLWRMRNWSRLFHIILYTLLTIMAIITFVRTAQTLTVGSTIWQVIILLIDGTIVWYLGLNKKLTSLFKK